MSQTIKLEDSELKTLRGLNSAHSVNINLLAENEVKISRLTSKKESLILRFETSEAKALDFENELTEKYGKNIRIDMNSGEIHKSNE